ncbi:MAG: AAA family ATPase [Planctomycetota bacterium]|nr:AAA family ATPase [Planctomycetota bacterium]
MDIREKVEEFRRDFQRLRDEIGKMIVGHEDVVEGVLICLFAGGHCLLEGVPGLGKTLLVRTLSQALELKFSRIQFTPDLMPADIVGTNLVVDDDKGGRCFRFQPGPVFAQIILADEINRATPKTQSALLEAMQEHSVTTGGNRYQLEEPFLVMATQNPIEMEGTYPLPEAQLDRFMFKVLVAGSSREQLKEILTRTTEFKVPQTAKVLDGVKVEEWKALVRETVVAPHLKDYAARLVLATHAKSEYGTELAKKYVRFGSSPRGAQAVMLGAKVRALVHGRYNIAFEDIMAIALPALRHRVLLNFEGEAEGVTTDRIVADALESTPKEPPAEGEKKAG